MVKEIEALLNAFAEKASLGLPTTIGELKIQLKGFEGKSLKEIQL